MKEQVYSLLLFLITATSYAARYPAQYFDNCADHSGHDGHDRDSRAVPLQESEPMFLGRCGNADCRDSDENLPDKFRLRTAIRRSRNSKLAMVRSVAIPIGNHTKPA